MVRRERDKKDSKTMIRFILLASIMFLGGCSTHTQTQSIETKETHLTTVRWGENDLQEMANKMVIDILSSPTIDFATDKVYSFGEIKNRSHDHIDTKELANKITTALIQSKKIKISKNKNHKSAGIFFGKISSIFKKNSRTKDMFFNFNLTLTDTQTSSIIWSHDVEIRKVYKKALFGW